MQTSYLEKNKREYEITKHVSLAQLDPLALVRLRATARPTSKCRRSCTTWTIRDTISEG